MHQELRELYVQPSTKGSANAGNNVARAHRIVDKRWAKLLVEKEDKRWLEECSNRH